MPIQEQLRLRALRMLTDAYQHSPSAVAWAYATAGLLQGGFTLRELSLGAGEVIVHAD